MDTKLKSFSHSIITKAIVFFIVVFCFTNAATVFLNIIEGYDDDFGIVSQKSYYHSQEYMGESSNILGILTSLTVEYKNEEHILSGGTITEEEIKQKEEQLFRDFRYNSQNYDHDISEEENQKKFEELYVDKLEKIKDELIVEDIKQYNSLLQRLRKIKGVMYYASDGENVYTNSPNGAKGYFKSFPSYLVFDKTEETLFPKEIKDNRRYYMITQSSDRFNVKEDAVYIGFTNEFLNSRIKNWNEGKKFVTDNLYIMAWFFIGLIISFIYLILVLGRRFFNDKDIQINFVDKLYVDINLVIFFSLIALWIGTMNGLYESDILQLVFPITFIIATFGLVFLLSLFKHMKNRTIIKHTLIFTIFYKIFRFIKDIYDSGSVAVKVVLIVIVYPALVAATFFMFPVTIGLGAWLALKKVKRFNAIKEGVEKIKNGDIYHKIDIPKNGEFAKLASNINSIADGLNMAVANELKSQRLKTELISNVSHDIRTPLTSIITYVDLLKVEEDIQKREEYIEIIEQKSHRLKILTDDLFEASKASSGNIPVTYEKIDIVSLITQGLGELNNQIEESNLDFKLSHPKEKVLIEADGKLLWRAVENLLSNIFKYALKGSRVYIDIEDIGNEIALTIKNISSYELNISSDELMERFKRGDESRTSEGSGLGLSIAKSLINIQRGSFNIEIDGDLFKAIIQMPKYRDKE